MEDQSEREELEGMILGFHKTPDSDALAQMSDIELAAWQANAADTDNNISGAILAGKEWERRAQVKQHELNKKEIELQHQRNIELVKEQVKWVRYSAILTAISTLTAAIAGACLTYMLTRPSPQQTPKIDKQETTQASTKLPTSASRPEKTNDKVPLLPPK